jgi:uncharacterized membrane protein
MKEINSPADEDKDQDFVPNLVLPENTLEKSLSFQQQSISKKEAEVRSLSIASLFSGPLPPPNVLKAYEIVEIGLAGRIVGSSEKQADHRMELEKAVVYGDGKRSWTGLVLGFIVVCLFLGCDTYLIEKGHELAGGLLAVGELATLTGVFVYGTNSRSQERTEKLRTLIGKGSDNI